MQEFKKYHPIVNFTYFLALICFSMFIMHPVFLGISFISALSLSAMANGIRKMGKTLLVMLPVAFFAVMVNVLLNHEGVTVLSHFPNGEPFTAEALFYGIGAAIMLISVISIFSAYNKVMTSDKFLYLFGKITPVLSLVLSMILRFIPLMVRRFKEIKNVQKAFRCEDEKVRFIVKCKRYVKMLSILITWSLENAMDTADSMISRGYGSGKRTSYSNFAFTLRDTVSLLWIAINSATVLFCIITGNVTCIYFPAFKMKVSVYTTVAVTSYLFLCLTPIISEVKEAYRWKAIK